MTSMVYAETADSTVLTNGDVVIVGNYEGVVNIGNSKLENPHGGFFARLDSKGQVEWVNQYGGEYTNLSGGYANSVTSLEDDSILVTGNYTEGS